MAQQLELAQRNSLSLQDNGDGKLTLPQLCPPPRGLQAESGRLLSVFQLSGPAALQAHHPHSEARHPTAQNTLGQWDQFKVLCKVYS